MMQKGAFIQQHQAIKEKERMFVPLDQMLVFAAQLIQGIDSAMPKSDKGARKYREALYSVLAPKFGFDKTKTPAKLKPMPEDEQADDDFIEGELLDESDEYKELMADYERELAEETKRATEGENEDE